MFKRSYTFDEICIVPQYNNIASRKDPTMDLSTWFTKKIKMQMPLIPANMDSVISHNLANVIHNNGGRSIYHRFCSKEDKQKWLSGWGQHTTLSCGVKREDIDEIFSIIKLYGEVSSGMTNEEIYKGIAVCLDIAHGHSSMMLDTIKKFKDSFPEIDIIAGNVCTERGYYDLCLAGADAVKVGVGAGAACLTRKVTGQGVPQFTAIYDCAKVAKQMKVPLIADGGIRDSRDISLALAAGASSVMAGKLFALTEESAAQKKDVNVLLDINGKYIDQKLKAFKNEIGGDVSYSKMEKLCAQGIEDAIIKVAKFRGQASDDFQQEFFHGKKTAVPEGDHFWAPVTGDAQTLIDKLMGGLRSSMTYSGSRTIKEFQEKAEFMEVGFAYDAESGTRKT